MIPSFEFTADLGPIESLVSGGVPDRIKMEVGRKLAQVMGERIAYKQKTIDGEIIDANSPTYADVKSEDPMSGSNQPLVFSGRMTTTNAWDITVEPDGVILELKPEHQEKWDNIMLIAENKGKNWNRAWGFTEEEIAYGIGIIERMTFASAGIETFGREDMALV